MPDPTMIVTEWGGIIPGTPCNSYCRGFTDLLDFTTPPVRRIAILPSGAPTTIGIARTGRTLRDAMTHLRDGAR
jgi:hypothetical protein